MYEHGQKFYTLKNNHSPEIIEWTFITIDQGNGYYVMKDQGGQYRNLSNLEGFCEHPELCHIDVYRRKIRSFKGEKKSIVKRINHYKDEIKRLQKLIKAEVERLGKTDKKIGGVTRHYAYLQDKYPEEFI